MTRDFARPDPRFYDTDGPVTLGELAALTGARLGRGAAAKGIARASTLGPAGPDAVSFLAEARHGDALAASLAGACFITEALSERAPPECALLLTPLPTAAWVMAANRLHRPRLHPAGAPAIHPSADLEEGVSVGRGASVGPGASVGSGTQIGAGTTIGPGVAIGRESYIGAGAVIGFALLGDRVRILAGAVIGEAGFGATPSATGIVDVPQLGRVIIQDGVTIGANSCVDRGAYDDTVIGENTKIDNLVQIGHNVVIGRNCVFAAQCGISGSVVIGDGCMFGGAVGVADHLTIGAGARLAARAGVAWSVPAGETWGGYPARPMRRWMRELAWLKAMAARRERGGTNQ
ncbi:MAG TPA: UDP-3-O-(3-hydroxymyristoyl)glucosamine N-acyltransferase [Caulobacteraceae bacterium]|nr:UDP-3-O-(3-hydroxymyristoyl)glucosamine N-acyltransferase [Caulobacteraceae bacterium]